MSEYDHLKIEQDDSIIIVLLNESNEPLQAVLQLKGLLFLFLLLLRFACGVLSLL